MLSDGRLVNAEERRIWVTMRLQRELKLLPDLVTAVGLRSVLLMGVESDSVSSEGYRFTVFNSTLVI